MFPRVNVSCVHLQCSQWCFLFHTTPPPLKFLENEGLPFSNTVPYCPCLFPEKLFLFQVSFSFSLSPYLESVWHQRSYFCGFGDNLWHCLARPASILLHKTHSSFVIQHMCFLCRIKATPTTHLEMALYLQDKFVDVDTPCKHICSFYVVMHMTTSRRKDTFD